jgi:hypothetical protein
MDMVLNATCNNISVISWWRKLPTCRKLLTNYHNVVLSTPSLSGIRTRNVRGDDKHRYA